ncbi:MAG TPA: BatA domain-containing protein, partial [Rhodothermales bacterium]|nr:BatA domain-containing protein [Rhodothermales bacterium]
MEFLNPLALVALAAAVIPLVIHLFNFRRPKRVDFSTLEFVKELQKTTMQRVRIKQWLLLLLRMLAIAFLVLAFARPTLTGDLVGSVGGQARSSVAIVIDNSFSMTLRDGGGEYLRQAKDIASGLVDVLQNGDEIFVVTTAGERPTRVESFSNRSGALEAVEDVEAGVGAESLPASVERAARLLDDALHLNKEIFVVSDVQRTSLPDTTERVLPDDIRVYLLPIGDRTYSNVAVTAVNVESRIIEVGQPVRISATLVNFGVEPLDGYVASVYLEGERLAQASADLAPNVPTTVTFRATPQRRGWLSGTVQIEDDAFTFDNERHFAVHVPEQRRILLVRGDGQSAEYMQLALSPELGRGRVSFDVTTIQETGLSAAGLGGFDAVLLVGPATLSSGEIAALGRYVEAGGGLLLTPAPGASAAEYNTLFDHLGAGEFTGFSGELASGRSIATFDRVDVEHPLFEGVFTREGLREERRIESADIYYAMNYTPSTGSEQTLIRLSNGFPFLQEIRHGRGAAFILAVAPNTRWSDVPVRGLFIPLMYRSMYYLSASESTPGEQLTAAQDAEIRIAGASESDQLRLVGPDGSEYVPEQRTLFGALLLSIEGQAVRTPGIYDVRSGESLIRRIAFNGEASESDLS